MTDRPALPAGPSPADVALARQALGITDAQVYAKRRADRKMITARELRALDLLVLGANYTQIAKVLDIKTRGGAVQLVQRALAKRAAEAAETTVPEARALYLERLEKLFQRYMPLALGNQQQAIPPDPMAAKLVLDMMTRFARVTGIESPSVVEQHVDVTITDPEVQRAQRDRVVASLQAFQQQSSQVIDGTATESAA